MEFKSGKFFLSAAVALSMGNFAVPFSSVSNATTTQDGISHSVRVQLAADDSKVEVKTQSTQSTDSAGMPKANTHAEHETTETANDGSDSAKTKHKVEVNESTNAMGDTTKQRKETTESSQLPPSASTPKSNQPDGMN